MTRSIVPLAPEELILTTDRLRLRPYAETDLDIAVLVLTDPEVVKYVCDPMSDAEVAALLPSVCRRGAGGRIGMWCVERLDTGEKLGDGVLTPIPVEEEDTNWDSLVSEAYPDAQIEVGYMLKRDAWGRGMPPRFARGCCSLPLSRRRWIWLWPARIWTIRSPNAFCANRGCAIAAWAGPMPRTCRGSRSPVRTGRLFNPREVRAEGLPVQTPSQSRNRARATAVRTPSRWAAAKGRGRKGVTGKSRSAEGMPLAQSAITLPIAVPIATPRPL